MLELSLAVFNGMKENILCPICSIKFCEVSNLWKSTKEMFVIDMV